MDRCYYSIINDVLGPIMTGPSSSHSAGCARIGKTVRGLIGREIMRADIVFEELGSYPSTYVGQGSNFGFTGGLLGYATDDPRLKDAVDIAKQEGREILFKKAPLGFQHPNQARIDVYDERGAVEMSLMTFSVGGGMFEITEMDGFSVMMNGGCDQVFIVCDTDEAIQRIKGFLDRMGTAYTVQTQNGPAMYTIRLSYGEDPCAYEEAQSYAGVRYVRFAKSVLPVMKRQDQTAPFFNAAEVSEYQKSAEKSLWQLAMDYETGYGHVTEKEVRDLISRVRDAMRGATTAPASEKASPEGFLAYPAREMVRDLKQVHVLDTGVLNQAMLAAVAVMENSCARGIVVASPTAGSSGVVPAAVVSVGDQLGCSDEEIDNALLAAGLVGVFIANQATFGGEVGACQAENGSASAMAAAGVVQLLGGTVEQGFRAASMALQNMLGLICDPVAGMTEVPCISRNVSAMANAVLSANMAVMGFDPVIPLDETILTMGRVGAALPAELRCTCKGGLCTSPTGCRLNEQAEAQRPIL